MIAHSHEPELRAFLSMKFGQDLSAFPLEDSLLDALGLDSLAGLELMADIEDEFDLYFTDEQISRPRTLGNILEALDASAWRAAS